MPEVHSGFTCKCSMALARRVIQDGPWNAVRLRLEVYSGYVLERSTAILVRKWSSDPEISRAESTICSLETNKTGIRRVLTSAGHQQNSGAYCGRPHSSYQNQLEVRLRVRAPRHYVALKTARNVGSGRAYRTVFGLGSWVGRGEGSIRATSD